MGRKGSRFKVQGSRLEGREHKDVRKYGHMAVFVYGEYGPFGVILRCFCPGPNRVIENSKLQGPGSK